MKAASLLGATLGGCIWVFEPNQINCIVFHERGQRDCGRQATGEKKFNDSISALKTPASTASCFLALILFILIFPVKAFFLWLLTSLRQSVGHVMISINNKKHFPTCLAAHQRRARRNKAQSHLEARPQGRGFPAQRWRDQAGDLAALGRRARAVRLGLVRSGGTYPPSARVAWLATSESDSW